MIFSEIALNVMLLKCDAGHLKLALAARTGYPLSKLHDIPEIHGKDNVVSNTNLACLSSFALENLAEGKYAWTFQC